MSIEIGGLVKQLKTWFSTEQAKIKAQAADLEAKLTQQNLSPLPAETRTRLSSKIDDLPPHPVHIGAVKSKLEESIDRWKSNRDAPNSLVILASPIEPIEAILQKTLTDRTEELPQVKYLSDSTRSPDGLNSKNKLFEKCGQ